MTDADIQPTNASPRRGGRCEEVEGLAALLREAEEHHGAYEAVAPTHHWSGWYAAYILAREQGRTVPEASGDARRSIDAELAATRRHM